MSDSAPEMHTVAKVSRRLLPFLFVLYIFSYLDRSNVSIAALQMNGDLGFNPAIFGLGAGMFFLGYALFELPSNLILARVGARVWIARIMVTWGLFATAMMLVATPTEFYSVRFLLGVAEAGFFPGVIYYLASWFPKTCEARAIARFTIAIPLAQVLGGLLGGPLLSLKGIAGLSGWQWLFVVEGLPSILLGIAVIFYLPDGPADAKWLSNSERDWLISRIETERGAAGVRRFGRPLAALRDPTVWLLIIPYFAYYTLGFGYVAWAPQLIKSALGTSDQTTPLITAGVALLSVVAYLGAASYSDRSADRCRYASWGLAVSSLGCLGTAFAPSPILQFAFLTFISFGSGIFLPSFWCLPKQRFVGSDAAAPIAVISGLGSSGGFFGPTIIGYAKHATGTDTGAFAALALIGIIGCFTCWALGRSAFRTHSRPELLSV
jgi:MFS transporter, ACS family, tartrate transporter